MKTPFLSSMSLLILLSTVVGCKQDSIALFCPKGYENLEFEEVELPLVTDDSELSFVINDDSTYQATFLEWINNNQNLFPNYSLPEIDFTQITLLGKYASGSTEKGNNRLIRRVCVNDESKIYKYRIGLVPTKDKAKHFGMNWIEILKVPSDYLVEIEIE